MVVYIANKPCRFGGQSYVIGDRIPADKILPRRAGSLVRMGVIIESEEPEKAPAETEPKAKEETPAAEAEPEKAPAETEPKAKEETPAAKTKSKK